MIRSTSWNPTPVLQANIRAAQRGGDYLLEVLDRVSGQTGTTYFLAYGSLLGALRDGGWIPWDDDIDVLMFRSDYEDLRRHFERTDRPTNVALSDSRDSCWHGPAGFGELVLLDSEVNDVVSVPTDTSARVTLDIWILDAAPRATVLFRPWMLTALALRLLTGRVWSLTRHTNRAKFLRVWACKAFHYWSRLPGRYLSDPEMYVNISQARNLVFTRYQGKQFLPKRVVKFEGVLRPIPQDAEGLLEEWYNDWRNPPDHPAPVHPLNSVHVNI